MDVAAGLRLLAGPPAEGAGRACMGAARPGEPAAKLLSLLGRLCYKVGPRMQMSKAQREPAPLDAPARPANASEYCPVCSERLEPRSCKLICPSCGYYMSCSDFY